MFSSGYLANLAVVTALAQVLGHGAQAGDGVLVVSDAANHASLIDALPAGPGAEPGWK